MRFGQVARTFLAGFRDWDARSKAAFTLAVVLLALVLFVGGRLPEDRRSFAVIGIIGLLVAMQAIFLYANRGMVTVVTKAQRLILGGHYDEARELLEQAPETQGDRQALTLLGNTYRMLGRLDDSRQTLTKALQIAPDHHFPLYSLGRTLMASGAYAEAADNFGRALEQGAPAFTQVDLAEARFRAGDAILEHGGTFSEPHIALMSAYVMWRAGTGERPADALIDAGLPFWEKTAERFAHTPYGADLQRDLATLRGLPRTT